MLILFMSPEPVINHHLKPSCYRESLDISSKGAPNTESEVAPTYRSICLFRGIGKRKSGVRSEVNGNMSPRFSFNESTLSIRSFSQLS